ncbi:MAG: NADP-dependent oxidoreductase domain-containing protein [Podila humilis]|nr:MAG: NADP-dependent oxidoreductase domain-containing protein [Podila humilis]
MKGTTDSTAINKTLTALDSYVLLGKSGLRVSPLALGTMTFGEQWGFGSNKETCRKLFDKYYEEGGNFFDTANCYTNGDSERFLGEYISGKRTESVVATKYSINPSSEDLADKYIRVFPNQGVKSGNRRPNPNAGGNHRKSLVETLDGSLKRMGTGYTDILYVHLWEYRTPVQEVMRALDDVVRSGKALYVGISDAPAWVTATGNTIAELRGLTPFIGMQTRFNMLNRSLEAEIQPMCAEHGLGIVPWGILAEGFLTGKHTREQTASTKRHVDGLLADPKNWRILDEVRAIAAECDKTPAQVALNWTMQKPGITSPLLGVRTMEQLEDNLGALEFKLSGEQMARLDLVSNPASWPFPQEVVQNLNRFVGLGLEMEVPEKFHAVHNLRSSSVEKWA